MPAFSTYIGHMTTEHTHSTEQRLLSVIICKKKLITMVMMMTNEKTKSQKEQTNSKIFELAWLF
jgi:hypothetical protein